MYYFCLHLPAREKQTLSDLKTLPTVQANCSQAWSHSPYSPMRSSCLPHNLSGWFSFFLSFLIFFSSPSYEVNFAPKENPDQTPHFPVHPGRASDQTEQLTQQTTPLAGLPLYPPARIRANTSRSIWRQGIAGRILWASQWACSGSLGTRQFSICHCSQMPWGLGWGPRKCTQVTTLKDRWGWALPLHHCQMEGRGLLKAAHKIVREESRETNLHWKFLLSKARLSFSSAQSRNFLHLETETCQKNFNVP